VQYGTGLGIFACCGDLNQDLQQKPKVLQLAIRVGFIRGFVVVGEMGGAGRQDSWHLGEVPTLLRALRTGSPNTMAVSEATYRLIQGYFECQDLGDTSTARCG